MSVSHAIELNAVDKRYEKTLVVDNVDLQVNPGECFVFVGHNGAGKTSLMKLMLGLTQPSAGQLMVMGKNPASSSFTAQRRFIGYLPENVSFYHHMTGLELLTYYARLKGVSPGQVMQRLEQVGIQDAATKRLNTFSKGMRQRLGLAQAILGEPRLLFLDEPTTGLDPSLRRDFFRIINDLRETGTTVVISSHSLNEIEAQADRIALIKSGKLVACGSLLELSARVGLPVRTRLSFASGTETGFIEQLSKRVKIESIAGNTIDLKCPENEKMSVLRLVADQGESIVDISMTAPRLDEIYLHYMAENGA